MNEFSYEELKMYTTQKENERKKLSRHIDVFFMDLSEECKNEAETWAAAKGGEDFLNHCFFQGRGYVDQSLWTRTETHSLQQQVLSSELSL